MRAMAREQIAPAAAEAPRWAEVKRELSRGRASRRFLPWITAMAVLVAAALAWVARTPRAALIGLVPGAVFYLLVAAASSPRCPACGARLWGRGEHPGSPTAPRETRVERERRCPRCGRTYV
jgi:hypothetical protein